MDSQSDLSGKRILVTRPTSFLDIGVKNDLSSLLKQKGALVVEKPLLSINPPASFADLDKALNDLEKFDWIVFASPRAVQSVVSRLNFLFDPDASKETSLFFKRTKIAAVGKSTANCLYEFGIPVDFHPEKFSANDLVIEFPEKNLAGMQILWPRTLKGEMTIHDGLEALGAQVVMAEAYSSDQPKTNTNLALELADLMESQLDIVTFTSSQTVRNFVSMFEPKSDMQKLSDRYPGVIVAVIGPKTAKTAIEIYGRADVVAGEYTIEGLVSSLERFLQRI